LAILFNNQGLVKDEFRAGLALVRVVESSVTALMYFQFGLFMVESQDILLAFIPGVLLGIPLGAWLFRGVDAETFRRICMSFDAWVVGFGLSRVLIELDLMASPWAYSVMLVTILIDAYMLYVFFAIRRLRAASQAAREPPSMASGFAGRLGSMLLGYYPFPIPDDAGRVDLQHHGQDQASSRNRPGDP
jgi:hypothetical protein